MGSDQVWVEGYTTRDGVRVSGYWRTHPRGDTSTAEAQPAGSPSHASRQDSAPGSAGRPVETEGDMRVVAGLAELRRMRAANTNHGWSAPRRACDTCGDEIVIGGMHTCWPRPHTTATPPPDREQYSDGESLPCGNCEVPLALDYDGRGTGWSHIYGDTRDGDPKCNVSVWVVDWRDEASDEPRSLQVK